MLRSEFGCGLNRVAKVVFDPKPSKAVVDFSNPSKPVIDLSCGPPMAAKPGGCRRVSMEDFVVEGTLVYSRPGVIIQAPKEDRLHSGLLRITETRHGAFLTWDKDEVQQNVSITNGRNSEERNGSEETVRNGDARNSSGDEGICIVRNGADRNSSGENGMCIVRNGADRNSSGENGMCIVRNGADRNSSGEDGGFVVGSPTDTWSVIADTPEVPTTPKDSVRFKASPLSESVSSPSVQFSSTISIESQKRKLRIEAEITEIKSYRIADDGNQVTFMMKDGTAHNSLIFLDEGPGEFLEAVRRYVQVKKSRSDECLFLFTDKRIAALDQSLSELNLLDTNDKSTSEIIWKTVGDFQKDPYTVGLSMFSKITDKILFSPVERELRPEQEMAELLQADSRDQGTLECMDTGQTDSAEWQLVTSRANTSLLTGVLPAKRHQPLCPLDWELHIDQDGVVTDVPLLLEKIYKGGMDENIRSEVWKFLLNYHKWHHTTEVRETNKKARVEEYFRMKLQWKSLSDDQENRFSGFRERKTQIEKDIGRTDRTHPYFQGDKNPNMGLLQDILMTYVMYNFDLGYVQGMSDLLSPILFVMQNEVDAFWCFVGFMDKVGSNFEFDQGGMKQQLADLTDIMKCVDPSLYNYLDTKESGNLYFCFRWLLIWFKREFSYNDTMTLWEVLWTSPPNYHLLVCLAILDTEKPSIIENKYGFTEILKHVNDMSHRIDLNATLARAESLYEVLKNDNTGVVNNKVRGIIGLPLVSCEADNTLTENGEEMLEMRSASKPVPILNGVKKERHVTDSSNTSSSLNYSSSVEVISELEDETRFESSIASNFF